jgi:hypothetical protein
VMDGLGEMELEHEGLQPSLKEVLVLEPEDEIELVLALIEDPEAVEAAEESSTLEEPLGVGLLELEELTGSLAHLGWVGSVQGAWV